MREIPVEEAVGTILCHDITRIIPNRVQERAFRRGHIVRPEDIPELLKLGKEHLFVWEPAAGALHEDDAARRLARAAAQSGLSAGEPSEGKVELSAAHDGLLKVDQESLLAVNSVPEVTLITQRHNTPVHAGEVVAGARVIPLVIAEERVAAAEAICQPRGGILAVRPYRPLAVGVVTTGSEVFKGRIPDGFGPVLKEKFSAFGCQILSTVYAPDDMDAIVAALRQVREAGAELICATGGMSVDPDDRTPGAIRRAGAQIVAYGMPVLPGNMTLLAYWDGIPVLGLPGCVMFKAKTAFDVLIPRLLAGDLLERRDIIELGHGGLLSGCDHD